jgi:hypothetical protein
MFKPAVFGSVLFSMLYVAFALALGLCCSPAGYQHGLDCLTCSDELYRNPDIIPCNAAYCRNMSHVLYLTLLVVLIYISSWRW